MTQKHILICAAVAAVAYFVGYARGATPKASNQAGPIYGGLPANPGNDISPSIDFLNWQRG